MKASHPQLIATLQFDSGRWKLRLECAPVFTDKQSDNEHNSFEIETEQWDDQDEDDWRCAHGLFDHRQKIAAARKASRTPINGLETANQKETRQPDS